MIEIRTVEFASDCRDSQDDVRNSIPKSDQRTQSPEIPGSTFHKRLEVGFQNDADWIALRNYLLRLPVFAAILKSSEFPKS